MDVPRPRVRTWMSARAVDYLPPWRCGPSEVPLSNRTAAIELRRGAQHLQRRTSEGPVTQEQSVPLVEPKAPRHPHRSTCHRAGLALLLAMVGVAGPAMATSMQPLDSIAEAAVAAVGAGDAQSAEAVLAHSLRLRQCMQPLQAVATGPTTAQVRCDDSPGWKLYVPVRVRREAEVVVLRTPAASGVPITAEQLVVQRRDI